MSNNTVWGFAPVQSIGLSPQARSQIVKNTQTIYAGYPLQKDLDTASAAAGAAGNTAFCGIADCDLTTTATEEGKEILVYTLETTTVFVGKTTTTGGTAPNWRTFIGRTCDITTQTSSAGTHWRIAPKTNTKSQIRIVGVNPENNDTKAAGNELYFVFTPTGRQGGY